MVTNVDRSGVGTVHQQDKTVNQVVDVLEGSGLRTVAVDGHVLTLESLDNKVGNNSAVKGVHSGTESVEDTGDTNVDSVLSVVTIGQGLSDTLALIVTGSGTDTVDVTPVVLSLRVLLGVTVDLRGRSDEESGTGSLGETEHVEGTLKGGLQGLDGVDLVVRGGSRAGKVVDLCKKLSNILKDKKQQRLTVNLDQEGLDDIVSNHLKVGVTDPMGDLDFVSCDALEATKRIDLQ